MNSPLQLDACHLVSISLELTDLDQATGQQDVLAHVTVGRRQDSERHWQVRLKVEFGGCKEVCAPCRGNVEMEGYFHVHPGYPADKIETLVRVNGSSILYGAIREMVSNLSARSVKGIYVLPSLSFIDAAASEGTKQAE